ncbi:MAG: hypothetical protein ACOCP4_01260 [Candidatus Woesearchaeota archaeon]
MTLLKDDDIIFVENKDNFNYLIDNERSDDLFIDYFAGTWGHCTTYGNSLIVDNLMDLFIDLIES